VALARQLHAGIDATLKAAGGGQGAAGGSGGRSAGEGGESVRLNMEKRPERRLGRTAEPVAGPSTSDALQHLKGLPPVLQREFRKAPGHLFQAFGAHRSELRLEGDFLSGGNALAYRPPALDFFLPG
jgi:hypothetical protein